jgi:hypothetical protein
METFLDIYFILSGFVTGYLLNERHNDAKEKGKKNSLFMDSAFIMFFAFFGGVLLIAAVIRDLIIKKAIIPALDFFGVRVFIHTLFFVKKGSFSQEEIHKIMNHDLPTIKSHSKIKAYFMRRQIWFVNKKNGTKPYSMVLYKESDNPHKFYFKYTELLKSGEIFELVAAVVVWYIEPKSYVVNEHGEDVTNTFGTERFNIVLKEIEKTKRYIVYKTINNPLVNKREYSVLDIDDNNYLVTAWMGEELNEQDSITFNISQNKDTGFLELVFRGEDMTDCAIFTGYVQRFIGEIEQEINKSKNQ